MKLRKYLISGLKGLRFFLKKIFANLGWMDGLAIAFEKVPVAVASKSICELHLRTLTEQSEGEVFEGHLVGPLSCRQCDLRGSGKSPTLVSHNKVLGV